MKNNCSGQCIAGIIIAIIFGALFVWTLVFGYQAQVVNRNVSAFVTYVLALVFLAIAKFAKMWGMGCPGGHMGGMGHGCCCGPMESEKKKKR